MQTTNDKRRAMTIGRATEIVQQIKQDAKVEWCRVDKLRVDERVQRGLSMSWVKKRAKDFDPNSIGVLCISRRATGEEVLLDGQHRAALLREVGWGDQSVQCEVFRDLALEEEAAIFLYRNDKKTVSAYDKFKARRTSKDSVAVGVAKIVEEVGLFLSSEGLDGGVAAVTALERAYLGCGVASQRDGAVALRSALQAIVQAWGKGVVNFHGSVIEGLAQVYVRNPGKKIQQEVMVTTLQKVSAGVTGLLSNARLRQHIHRSESLPRAVAESVISAYNVRRRIGKLA